MIKPLLLELHTRMLAVFVHCVRYSVISLLMSLSGSLLADTLYLSNGDMITGTVQSLRGGRLLLSTEYTDRMLVNWSSVNRIIVDRVMIIYLKNDETLQGKLCLNRTKSQFSVDNHTFSGVEQILQIYPLSQHSYGIGWSGDVTLSGKIEHNAAENSDYSSDISLVHRLGKNRHTFGVDAGKTKDNDVETKKEFQFDYAFDRFITDKWYVNSNYEYQTNAYQDLRKQNILGVGAGYSFLDNAEQTLSIEPGLAYTNQTFNQGVERNDLGFQWKLSYEKKSVLKWFDFFHNEQILLPRFTFRDAYYDIDTGFRMNLPSRLYLQLSYEWKYDQSPDAIEYKKDSTTALGLGYHW